MPFMGPSSDGQVYVFGEFTLDVQRRALSQGNHEIALGSRALDLLIALVEGAGEVLSRDRLVARVWPRTIVEDSSLRVHVAALRKALDDRAGERRYIANVPGRGYTFVGEVSRQPRNFPAPRPIAEPPQHPCPLGREATLMTLSAMVVRCPVVSVVGPGGVGKTSVAQHAFSRMASGFADGAHWVDLSLSHPAHVVTQVAQSLGRPGADLASLASFLYKLQ
jgi:DNA-binding winged helix-turn-helix (wHTH) protein